MTWKMTFVVLAPLLSGCGIRDLPYPYLCSISLQSSFFFPYDFFTAVVKCICCNPVVVSISLLLYLLYFISNLSLEWFIWRVNWVNTVGRTRSYTPPDLCCISVCLSCCLCYRTVSLCVFPGSPAPSAPVSALLFPPCFMPACFMNKSELVWLLCHPHSSHSHRRSALWDWSCVVRLWFWRKCVMRTCLTGIRQNKACE